MASVASVSLCPLFDYYLSALVPATSKGHRSKFSFLSGTSKGSPSAPSLESRSFNKRRRKTVSLKGRLAHFQARSMRLKGAADKSSPVMGSPSSKREMSPSGVDRKGTI